LTAKLYTCFIKESEILERSESNCFNLESDILPPILQTACALFILNAGYPYGCMLRH